MENLQIDATKSSPEINFDAQTNILTITGESYPENTTQFYESVFIWIEEYIENITDEEIFLNREVVYFNSGSSKRSFNTF